MRVLISCGIKQALQMLLLSGIESSDTLSKACKVLQLPREATFKEMDILPPDIRPLIMKKHSIPAYGKVREQLNAKPCRHKNVTTRKPARGKHKSF